MNIYTWIFTGLLSIDIVLYIVAMLKKLGVLEKVARSLVIPFMGGLIHSILAGYLPDSYHILLTSAIAFVAALIYILLMISDKNKFIKMGQEFLYEAIQIIWLMLIISVYRIYRVPQWLFILAGTFYFAGLVIICIFIKKQSFTKYFAALFMYIVSTTLGITSLVSLIYEKRIFSVMMFISSLVFMFGTVFTIFQKTRPFDITEKTEKLLATITVVTANALFGVGALLMQI